MRRVLAGLLCVGCGSSPEGSWFVDGGDLTTTTGYDFDKEGLAFWIELDLPASGEATLRTGSSLSLGLPVTVRNIEEVTGDWEQVEDEVLVRFELPHYTKGMFTVTYVCTHDGALMHCVDDYDGFDLPLTRRDVEPAEGWHLARSIDDGETDDWPRVNNMKKGAYTRFGTLRFDADGSSHLSIIEEELEGPYRSLSIEEFEGVWTDTAGGRTLMHADGLYDEICQVSDEAVTCQSQSFDYVTEWEPGLVDVWDR